MTQKNPYLINDKLPKIETISYYDVETDQNLSAEEWNKLNFLSNEDITVSPNGRHIYISEKAYNKGIAMYGPGFWGDFGSGAWEVTKFGAKLGGSIAIGTMVAATGPFAIPIGAGLAASGYGLKQAAEDDSPVLEFIGDTVMGGGFGAVTGGLLGTGSGSLASKGANAAFREGVRTAGTNGSAVLLRTWIYTTATQHGYELIGKGKNGMEAFCHFYHGKHKNNGISYASDCPICNGHFDKFFFQLI